MTLNDFTRAVYDSKPNQWIFNDQKGIYVLIDDLNIRIVREEIEDDDLIEKFSEPWVKVYADKSARKITYQLFYSSSYIKEELLIAVDGYRAYIPIPKSQFELKITKNQYNFGRIINAKYENDYDEYLKRAKIEAS